MSTEAERAHRASREMAAEMAAVAIDSGAIVADRSDSAGRGDSVATLARMAMSQRQKDICKIYSLERKLEQLVAARECVLEIAERRVGSESDGESAERCDDCCDDWTTVVQILSET